MEFILLIVLVTEKALEEEMKFLLAVKLFELHRLSSDKAAEFCNMNKVHFCGNTHFKETTVKYTYTHDDKYLIVDDVPCKQCEYCGEQHFKADILKSIEHEFNEIHLNGKVVSHEIKVPMEQFKEIAHI